MPHRFTNIDVTTLPFDLLPLAKQHMRIDFEDDDALVMQYLGNAIQIVEDVWCQRINPVEVDWFPAPNDISYAYQLPLQPCTSAVVSSGGIDQTGYSIYAESRTSAVYLIKDDLTPWPSDATVKLTAGFASGTDMPPAYTGPILRVTATLYERRETITTPLILVPYWLNDLIVGNWVPRV